MAYNLIPEFCIMISKDYIVKLIAIKKETNNKNNHDGQQEKMPKRQENPNVNITIVECYETGSMSKRVEVKNLMQRLVKWK